MTDAENHRSLVRWGRRVRSRDARISRTPTLLATLYANTVSLATLASTRLCWGSPVQVRTCRRTPCGIYSRRLRTVYTRRSNPGCHSVGTQKTLKCPGLNPLTDRKLVVVVKGTGLGQLVKPESRPPPPGPVVSWQPDADHSPASVSRLETLQWLKAATMTLNSSLISE